MNREVQNKGQMNKDKVIMNNMKKKEIKIAHLVYKDKRLYLEYSFRGQKLSETDVTPLWHFFRDFQDYLKEPKTK